MIWEWAAADLARAQLDSAQLSHDDLRRANLNGAHLANADLEYTRLDGARLVGAVLTRADLKDAHLQRAVLWEARLDSSRMREVHLDGADLGSADLRWAGLQGASFAQAKLAGARLNSAIVCGADFRDTNVTVEQLETTHGYELAVLDEPVRVKLDFLHPAPALTNDELKYGPAYLNLARGPSSTGPGEDAERERTQYQAWRAAWLQMQRVRPGTKSRFVPDSIGATLETTVLTMGEKTQIRKETIQELIREYHHDRTSRDVRMDSTEIVVLNDSLFNQVKVKARNHCVNIDGIGQ
jgi:hypothetical protein